VGIDVDTAVSQMTLREKCDLLAGSDGWHTTGCSRLGIPPVMMADGPHGLRKQKSGTDALGFSTSDPVTCFPTASALACSFDERLLERVGRALGEECRAEGVSLLLGPGVNMKRSPLCGRNFEYFSEDPYAAGRLAAAQIRGIQSCGVGAAVKHFMGNSQEKARMTSDSVIDERAMREVYLPAFRTAVEEGRPWVVMTAYNRVNGAYCSQNRFLLTDILRNEWGFDGMTVTDWEALSSATDSLPAGLDLVMPGPRLDYSEALRHAAIRHLVSRRELDSAVAHVLGFVDRCLRGREVPCSCDIDEHGRLAREAAARSAVLLENDGTLPIGPDCSVAVIGAFARYPRYQGAGSSKIEPRDLDCFWDALGESHRPGAIAYAAGYDAATGLASEAHLEEAERIARSHDVAIVFAGLPDSYESEGFDRRSMHMPSGHTRLIERVCAANPRTVVVLQGGAPFEMPWRGLPAAIVLMYLSGCQGGHATLDLVSGAVCPGGKLAETWPERLADTPTAGHFPDPVSEILYTESIYIGYRYYDAAGVEPAYPFGYGLSYTRFEYGGMALERVEDSDRFEVSCSVCNVGGCDGSEIVQLYIAPAGSGAYRAPQTLEGFARIDLVAGECRRAVFCLDRNAFATYDAGQDRMQVEAGSYEVRIGASSRDIRLRTTIRMDGCEPCGDNAPRRYHRPYPGCFSRSDPHVEEDFKHLYGDLVLGPRPLRPFTIDSTLSDTRHTVYGKIFAPLIFRRMEQSVLDDRLRKPYAEMIEDMPIRSMHLHGWRMSSAAIMVDVLNRRYISGLRMWRKRRRVRRASPDLPEDRPSE
jgi:beta-glucosidase